MKKIILMAVLSVMMTTQAAAQQTDKVWTLNSRAWSTNYFTTALYCLANALVTDVACKGNTKDSLMLERILPDAALVFPIGMQKTGFGSGDLDIYGPYHRAFGNPFKNIGDYAIGVDASYKPSFVGVYAGAYFKSQEIVWRDNDENTLRGFYFQPRVGIKIGSSNDSFEAGVYYDVVTGCGGTLNGKDKDMLKGGPGLDFAFATCNKKGTSELLIQFSMPLHNFFNTDNQNVSGLKRKVGYLMLTKRIYL